MTLKQRRLSWMISSLVALGMAVGLLLLAAGDTVTFFFSPSELAQKAIIPERRLRVGGLVAEGSVQRKGTITHFVITDKMHTVQVTFSGILPDLFREGQGVVAEGRFGSDGVLHASDVLAKHDATYTPIKSNTLKYRIKEVNNTQSSTFDTTVKKSNDTPL